MASKEIGYSIIFEAIILGLGIVWLGGLIVLLFIEIPFLRDVLFHIIAPFFVGVTIAGAVIKLYL